MTQLSKIIFKSNYSDQDHLIVRLKIWLRSVWRFKEVFLEFFFRYKLFSDRALSNLKSIGIEQVRLDSTIFARQPPNVCPSSSRDERWKEEEKTVAKKGHDHLRRLIADSIYYEGWYWRWERGIAWNMLLLQPCHWQWRPGIFLPDLVRVYKCPRRGLWSQYPLITIHDHWSLTCWIWGNVRFPSILNLNLREKSLLLPALNRVIWSWLYPGRHHCYGALCEY